jgi:hypothetical protein
MKFHQGHDKFLDYCKKNLLQKTDNLKLEQEEKRKKLKKDVSCN